MVKFYKNMSVAHSPDADDIFMYAAISFGWISDEIIKFSAISADIQTLNEATIKGIYDICAISFGLYPLVFEDYALLDTALSFGKGYGPKLIKRKNTSLKNNFKVALSGEHTSNALLFKIAYPNAKITYMNFLEIENAVLEGKVDAGVLIHESILDFNNELCVEREIWDIWCEFNKSDKLPLPLGAMAIRRSLPLLDAIKAQELLKKAVYIATIHKNSLCKMLLERNQVRVNDKQLDTYLGLYANNDSICLNELTLNAIDRLFELGYEYKFYPQLITASKNLIPTEYKNLRNS